MRILLVEDDRNLASTLVSFLREEGHEAVLARTLEEARQAWRGSQPECAILDVGLPDGSGFDLAAEIRAERDLPILFLTAWNTAEHRLRGYELGAAEFIPKPFHFRELSLRLRRVANQQVTPERIELDGGGAIDLRSRSVAFPDGATEFLPRRDFELLKILLEKSPEVVSRDELLDRVWGQDQFPSNRTVDNVMVRLRRALRDPGSRYIRSVRGVGYQWAPEGDV